ncbi:hypothetical protein LH442_01095 [Laribacter hongkongensis]|uniref:hypothetical protein n=1 Tax=Laribacter hongkongensis TaxID=168471 RepID=UPI001EFE97A3|nr:hypothetical protein [Laribacter hongkongensis]MCG9054597.1 hypothetical protein [Laribacter hongkongensis]
MDKQTESHRRKLYELLETHGVDVPNLGDLTHRLRELMSSFIERIMLNQADLQVEYRPDHGRKTP